MATYSVMMNFHPKAEGSTTPKYPLQHFKSLIFKKISKVLGWDFRFQNYRIQSIFDNAFFDTRRCTDIYSKEFAFKSHRNLNWFWNLKSCILYIYWPQNVQSRALCYKNLFNRFQIGCTRFQGVADPSVEATKTISKGTNSFANGTN